MNEMCRNGVGGGQVDEEVGNVEMKGSILG
jgi:hypothetical protein